VGCLSSDFNVVNHLRKKFVVRFLSLSDLPYSTLHDFVADIGSYKKEKLKDTCSTVSVTYLALTFTKTADLQLKAIGHVGCFSMKVGNVWQSSGIRALSSKLLPITLAKRAIRSQLVFAVRSTLCLRKAKRFDILAAVRKSLIS